MIIDLLHLKDITEIEFYDKALKGSPMLWG
jgi:hypothetical protein